MMHPLVMKILPLIHQGYCCSQLLMLLLMQSVGHENPELIRAVHGLCYGIGSSEGPCGLLTGGACVIGCVAGRGKELESAHAFFDPLVNDYQQWFAERTAKYGGTDCFQIMQGLSAAVDEQPNPSKCGDFFAECWEKLCALFEEYEISMEPR